MKLKYKYGGHFQPFFQYFYLYKVVTFMLVFVTQKWLKCHMAVWAS